MNGDYGISIKEGGVALQTDGNTNITTTSAVDKLTIEYNGAAEQELLLWEWHLMGILLQILLQIN